MDEEQKQRWRGGEEHWRGGIDADVRTLYKVYNEIKQDLKNVQNQYHELELKVQALATKIAIYASLGAFAGSSIVSVIIGLVFKK